MTATTTKPPFDPLILAVAELFQIDPSGLTEESGAGAIKGWDSLGQIRLMYELEERFALEFDIMEIPALKSIGLIRAMLRSRGIEF